MRPLSVAWILCSALLCVVALWATALAHADKRAPPRFAPLQRRDLVALLEASRAEAQPCLDAALSRGAATVRARIYLDRELGPSVALTVRAPGRDPIAEACLDAVLRPRLTALMAERYVSRAVSATGRFRGAAPTPALTAARAAIRRALPSLRACLEEGSPAVALRVRLGEGAPSVEARTEDGAAPSAPSAACLDEAARTALASVPAGAVAELAVQLRAR